jgi:hypothetical protein
VGPLAWAFLIILGGLMLTPEGIDCIACGDTLSPIIGIIAILIGIAAFALNWRQVAVGR